MGTGGREGERDGGRHCRFPPDWKSVSWAIILCWSAAGRYSVVVFELYKSFSRSSVAGELGLN
jgi:hypothetical protein